MKENQTILVADDDPQMQLALKASLTRAGYEVSVVSDGCAALQELQERNFDAIISDQRMPEMSGQELLAAMQSQGIRTPFIMITAYGTIDQAVQAMQLGATDFISKPFSTEDLERVVTRVLSPEIKSFREQINREANPRDHTIITNHPLMIRILEVAEAVAKSDATVLIQGESGTGKELVARLIHGSSPRVKQPFVAVNCAALPDNLLESELFGHEKGAFTGAQQRKPGKFELAHGGTILLDEISEMDVGLQAKLLRVLQEREVDRVGGRDPISIDVRVIATTNRNLEECVRGGTFRADLYYRLNVIPLTLLPLRERRSDLKLLVKHFMRRYLGERAPIVTSDVMSTLEAYDWPGNIRELQNAVERAAILSAGNTPQTGHFFLSGSSLPSLTSASVPLQSARFSIEREVTDERESESMSMSSGGADLPSLLIRSGMTVQEMERALIMETLKKTNDNRTQAAKLLGISIRTLRNKLHEYGYAKRGDDLEL
jgi:DNA-binding NtrC family response regulator